MIPFEKNHFFFGVVEDVNDPETRGRCKVRIVGIHSEDKMLVPTETLPWCEVSLPSNNPILGGKGTSPNGLLVGSCVGGIFTDPEDMQQPLVFFAYGGNRAVGGDTNAGAFNAMGTAIYGDGSNSGCISADSDPTTEAKNNSTLAGGTQIGEGGQYSTSLDGLKLQSKADMTGGGKLHPGAIAYMHWVQSNIPGFFRFTSGNDKFHQDITDYRSIHTTGRAVDFSMTPGTSVQYKSAADRIRQLMKAAGCSVELLDEKNKPSRKATGPHIHLAFRSDASANQFLSFINGGSGSAVKIPVGDPVWMTEAKTEIDSKTDNIKKYYDETKITRTEPLFYKSAMFINYVMQKVAIRATKMDIPDTFKKHGSLIDIGVLADYVSAKKPCERGSVVVFGLNGKVCVGLSLGTIDKDKNLDVYTMLDKAAITYKVPCSSIQAVRWPTDASTSEGTAPIQQNYNTDCASSGDMGDGSSGSSMPIGAGGDWANSVFGELIGKHESKNDYSAFNRGTGTKAQYNTNIDKLPLKEIIRRQNLPRGHPDKLFAVGRWQVVGKPDDTLGGAVKSLKLNKEEIFDKKMQDHIMNNYLCAPAKRPHLAKFLNGDGPVREAAYDAAKEWASVGVEPGRRRNDGSKAGPRDTYYGVGNAAGYPYTTVVEALNAAKAAAKK